MAAHDAPSILNHEQSYGNLPDYYYIKCLFLRNAIKITRTTRNVLTKKHLRNKIKGKVEYI